MASSKKASTLYATVRSPKHVEKLLRIYEDVENTPSMTIDTKSIFDKHNLLPKAKLYYEHQTDNDEIKVIVTGNITPLFGFLQDEEFFDGKVIDDKVIINVQDDLTFDDIKEGLSELCQEWGWNLITGRKLPDYNSNRAVHGSSSNAHE